MIELPLKRKGVDKSRFVLLCPGSSSFPGASDTWSSLAPTSKHLREKMPEF
jgi:hypothetical protein